jgi:hypothetical protein
MSTAPLFIKNKKDMKNWKKIKGKKIKKKN